MLIGNTILGLAKLARLMKLLGQNSHTNERANVDSLEILAHMTAVQKTRAPRKGKIRLNDKENPVPEWLETIMSLGLENYLRAEAANSNSVSKAAEQQAASAKQHQASFSARINAQKATEPHNITH